ncbi:nucleotidyl transferase AbiEii/AbiGii toxin family protein [Micromonospora sp. NPDC049799]|uniref:nucleotidyl transferase AbiEii/AbiGii toxin family protein n=1 Tax=Micromonospora sp. NPDC049799 TaxID=3154741 RepID=UPI0033E0E53A
MSGANPGGAPAGSRYADQRRDGQPDPANPSPAGADRPAGWRPVRVRIGRRKRIAAHGILDRPSEDADLFVDWQPRADFPTAVDEVITAYRAEGFRVDIDLRLDTFARLHVADPTHPDQQHRVELVANWRAQPPAMVTNPILVRTVSRPGPPSTHSVQLPTLRIDPGANRS